MNEVKHRKSESAVHRTTHLLMRVKGGNPLAFDELVDWIYNRVGGLCQALKRNFPGLVAYEQTGDVMGEVWPKLLGELRTKEFKDSAHFFSFSARLIRNVLIDLLRKHYGRNGKGARAICLDPLENSGQLLEGRDSHSPDREAMHRELHHLISRLPEMHRAMFDLRFYHGLKEAECAELLRVDVRTIRRRWRSARLALAQELGK